MIIQNDIYPDVWNINRPVLKAESIQRSALMSKLHVPWESQKPAMSPSRHLSPHCLPPHPWTLHGFSIGLTHAPCPSQIPLNPPRLSSTHSSPHLAPMQFVRYIVMGSRIKNEIKFLINKKYLGTNNASQKQWIWFLSPNGGRGGGDSWHVAVASGKIALLDASLHSNPGPQDPQSKLVLGLKHGPHSSPSCFVPRNATVSFCHKQLAF